MAEITQRDMLIILKAAIQMSNVDESLASEERAFLTKLLKINNLGVSKLQELRKSVHENITSLSEQLSSQTAKKAFLLTIAAMALADNEIDAKEEEMLAALTKKLKVGRVRLNELTYQSCEATVLRLLSQVEPQAQSGKKKEKLSHEQLSDFDLL